MSIRSNWHNIITTIITTITIIIITTTTTTITTTTTDGWPGAGDGAGPSRSFEMNQRRHLAFPVAAPRMWRYVPSKTVLVADVHSVSADSVARLS
jgi:hypothetical protein